MANEIKLITFADSEVTATDDAYVYETATGAGGIINGSVVTIKSASELHITGGNGILCGRKFTIYDSDIPVQLSASGSLLGRLYIHMDLSNASEPITLEVETGASLTPCVQDADVNATNGVYEINLATFDIDTSTISNLADVAPKAEPREVLNTVADCVASTNPGDIAGASCIKELKNNADEYVEVVSTVNETYRSMVYRLYQLIDRNKITQNTMLHLIIGTTIYRYYLGVSYDTGLQFMGIPNVTGTGVTIARHIFGATLNDCYWANVILGATTMTVNDLSNSIAGNGTAMRLYYR